LFTAGQTNNIPRHKVFQPLSGGSKTLKVHQVDIYLFSPHMIVFYSC